MYPEFVLIRYSKTCRHRNDCHEGRNLYSWFPRNMKLGMSRRANGEVPGLVRRCREWGKMGQSLYCGFSGKVKARQGKQAGLASLNHFWGSGM